MATHKPITFASNSGAFTATLNKRVNEYFTTRKLSRHANTEMVVKTIFMFALYLTPYFLIVTGAVSELPWLVVLVGAMGLGLAGIGLSVMHDANHGAYSQKKWVNTVIGYSLNFVGANAFNWKIQHNLLHHSYTNIHDEDEDISSRGVLRLSPHSKWNRIHQYQFLYAWFLYGLMTLVWMTTKDFVRLVRYQRNGLIKVCKANLVREWSILVGTKVFYATYIFLIPLLFTPLLWWQILAGFAIMHFITGFVLGIIFQPAHVIEGTAFPVTDAQNKVENNWTVHQLLTTTNFGNKSRWFSWYVGGLNFQIEHHLFPHICHVHYRKIAEIVISTTKEFGLPYKSSKTFLGALTSHANLLRQLGRRPKMETAT